SMERADAPLRKVPVAWEALEDAFENNAPEVHSYLHMGTGEVIRVVDGVADPATHGRIAIDSSYLRVDPVSSREQYRWMERFIATVEEGPLRQKLLQSIDGKGAFRRFKDVLVAFPVDRERWFTFRSERLRTCMESWLEAQGVVAVERPEWQVPTADDVRPALDRQAERQIERPLESAERPVVRRTPAPPRPSGIEGLRTRAHDVIDSLSPRELEAALVYLEFMRDRARSAPPPPLSAPATRELSLVAPTPLRDRDSLRDQDDDADEP
ncbi:MAG: hypothetical protein JWN04_4997, partial [Myxococcaceae bacterium]|nr:hypothetical protein [Myxococcaceae bacterium]